MLGVTLSAFSQFTVLRIYLIIGDIVSFLIKRIYNNLEDNIINTTIDPYFSDKYLDSLEITLPIFTKSKIRYGHFLINLIKNLIFIFITFLIYLIVKKLK